MACRRFRKNGIHCPSIARFSGVFSTFTLIVVRPLKLTVSRVKGGKGNSKFRVNGLKNPAGGRHRRYFPTKKDALDFCSHMQELYLREGYEGASLSREERAQATACIRRLARVGKTLMEVTEQVLRENKPIDRAKDVRAVAADFLAAQKADGRRTRYIADIRQTLKKFSVTFGARSPSDILTREIDDWLRDAPIGAVARNNRRRVLHVFFGYAVVRGFSADNPVSKTSVAKGTPPKKEIFSVEAAKALLDAAPADMVPCIAISLFAGIRTKELLALDWSTVRLDTLTIEIDSTIAKGRSLRFVAIQPNLAEWLRPHAKPKGPVAPVNMKRRHLVVRELAGLCDASGNVLRLKNHARHSFGSYRLAVIHDEQKVAREMGNSPAIVQAHYARPIPEATALRYWAIVPTIPTAPCSSPKAIA